MNGTLRKLLKLFLRNPILSRLEEAQEYFEQRLFDKEREILIELAHEHASYFLNNKNSAERDNLCRLLIESYDYDNALHQRMSGILHFNLSSFPFDDRFIEISLQYIARQDITRAIPYAELWYAKNSDDEVRMKFLRTLYIRHRDFEKVAILSKKLFCTDQEEFSRDVRGLLQVFDASSQHEYIRGEQCECGQLYEFFRHVNRSDEGLSECWGICPVCQYQKRFLFSNNNETFHRKLLESVGVHGDVV